MYLVCESNPKFEETIQLREAAEELGIETAYEPWHPDWLDSFLIYGTRDFVLPWVDDKCHLLSKQEYLYDYSFLLSIFNWELFNDEACIIPAGKLAGSWMATSKSNFFVRPNSGNKQFTGLVLTPDELKRDITYRLNINPWELVIVAPEQDAPEEEYRFFCKIDENEEITLLGCRYLPTPWNIVPSNVLEKAKEYAHIIFDKMTVGSCFVLDIFVHDDNISIGELNSVNSAAFYCIDPKEILKFVWGKE